jgi:hypothetical protein
MLRNKPSTPLVCLVVLVITTLSATAMAAETPDESLDILINAQKSTPAPETYRAKPKFSITPAGQGPRAPRTYSRSYNRPIVKVKRPLYCPPTPYGIPCILPAPRYRQWEMSMQVLFARTRGSVEWPRRGNNYWAWNQYSEADFNGNLKLPEHEALAIFSAKYQFRSNWGLRYVLMSEELSAGGNSDTQFWFGNRQFNQNEIINSKWEHVYQRLELVYDAFRSCSGALSVFAGWTHTDDKINVNCQYCGNYSSTMSVHSDLAIMGLEFQKCLKTAPNGGTFSSHCKVGFLFLDNSEGWDIEAALKYSIPVNCGRWGFLKTGYRFIDIKRSETRFVLDHAVEGGFLEFGFVF